MMCPPVEKESVEFDPTLGQLLSPWLAARTPLFHEDLADPDGVVRSYSIYGLGDEAVGVREGEPAPMSHGHPTLADLRATVQKQRHREIGNWLARRVARPTAVYGSWVAVRLGLSPTR